MGSTSCRAFPQVTPRGKPAGIDHHQEGPMVIGLNPEEQVAPLATPSALRPPSGAGATVAPRLLSLRRNFSWTLAGNIVYAGCQWGVLVILAKLGTPEMVGQFALGLAVTAPVIIFANLALRGVQVTDANRQ